MAEAPRRTLILMSDKTKSAPSDREARLAEALRANLRRRKGLSAPPPEPRKGRDQAS
jgi:hypothetical protein